ncbi:hypothetical protein LY76DRAFT_326869 [Colletotrichum caudatum]|nr:hypothetical protein LY76DRAFT_326869 [Colletotrichum caudatum]
MQGGCCLKRVESSTRSPVTLGVPPLFAPTVDRHSALLPAQSRLWPKSKFEPLNHIRGPLEPRGCMRSSDFPTESPFSLFMRVRAEWSCAMTSEPVHDAADLFATALPGRSAFQTWLPSWIYVVNGDELGHMINIKQEEQKCDDGEEKEIHDPIDNREWYRI